MSAGEEVKGYEFEVDCPPAHVFESASEAWGAVNFDELRKEMDKTGYEIADRQEASLVARKALAEATRAFKKASDEEKARLFAPLLKSYQKEIDTLTRRSRSSESQFLSLYRTVHPLPDPSPLLRHPPRLLECADLLRGCRSELLDLRGEISGQRNREATIARLEKEKAEAAAEIAALREKWAAEAEEAAAEAEARVVAEQRSVVEELHGKVEELRVRLEEQGGFYEKEKAEEERRRGKAEERLAREMAERRAMESDWRKELEEAARGRDAARAECAALAEALAEARSGAEALTGGAEDPAADGGAEKAAAATAEVLEEARELRARCAALEADLSNVSSARDALEAAVAQSNRLHREEVSRAREELAAASAERDRAEAEVAARPSPEEFEQVRKELRALRALGYNILDDDDDDNNNNNNNSSSSNNNYDDTEGGGGGGGSGAGTGAPAAAGGGPSSPHGSANPGNAGVDTSLSIETLLSAKCRKLESELTRQRVALADAVEERDVARKEVAALAGRVGEQAALIASLEEQVVRASSSSAGPGGLLHGSTASPSLTSAAGTAGAASTSSTSSSSSPASPFSAPGARVQDDAGAVALEGIIGDLAVGESASASTAGQAAVASGTGASASAPSAPASSSSPSFPSAPSSSSTTTTTSSSSSSGGDMLRIVTQQRDRFWERIAALEDGSRTADLRAAELNDQIRVLRADNLSLYEKIRYLESYRLQPQQSRDKGRLPSAGGGGAAQGGATHRAGGSDFAGSSAAEERYRELYEESVNPFNAFSRNERLSRYNNLNPAEKITLSSSKILLSTKWARMGLFFYSLLLHSLVFFALFHSQKSTHDLACPPVPHPAIPMVNRPTNPFAGAGRHPRPHMSLADVVAVTKSSGSVASSGDAMSARGGGSESDDDATEYVGGEGSG